MLHRLVPLALIFGAAGCHYTEIRKQCPSCTVFGRSEPPAPVAPGTRAVFVLVPGILGFGWEWDEPLAMMRAAPDSAIEVFDWSPSGSFSRIAFDLASRLGQLLRRLPPSVEHVVVFGHSAGGLITAFAAGQLRVPLGQRVHIVNIGTPYAGMRRAFHGGSDFVHGPFVIALGGDITRYPALAPRITLESFLTGWPGDPVMEPVFGRRPDDPRIGPPGPRHAGPPGVDHNAYIALAVGETLAKLGLAPRTAPIAGCAAPGGESACAQRDSPSKRALPLR